jgi:hypothetical protein
MNKRISVSLALVLAAQSALALDFKGVTLGGFNTLDNLKALGVDTPTGKTELEGMIVFSRVTFGADQTVQQIDVEFKPYQFAAIAAAAQRKYGKPTSSATIPMQNDYGAQLINHVEVWEREGWTICIFKYVDSDSGSLTIKPHQTPADPSKSRM